ncbi:MAG: two-component system response regulator [Bacteroidetes bacterium GWF2_38_335]|nr:MAG: two-component system response regulator [Bacteroidetes bacterium GWF2_38_335]OFY81284.1 MAG: two-component system response regulator [Bacteroidetes bacterium RIFOXYA12_FULL_38_20]HBS85403.1 two-component system response regulator [Bacteroidales bacterium]
MRKIHILWTDDEIEFLKPHIMFLEEKGFVVSTASNGSDAIQMVKQNAYDIIFLDENMPGKSGLEVLTEINKLFPGIPIVMVTKSEEEDIMEQAIGSKISDYLIKPVNPKQILLTIKKLIDNKRLITEQTTRSYQTEFGKLGMQINSASSFDDWVAVYKELVYWEIEMDKANDRTMDEVLKMQKNDANSSFAKFIKRNYFSWFEPLNKNRPLLSPNIFKDKVIPLLNNNRKVAVILIDNLRYDQWKVIQPAIRDYFTIEDDTIFCSILPTATQYARNSIFAGLMPADIDLKYPDLWLDDEEEGGKNMHEEDLIQSQLQRFGIKDKFSYNKINSLREGQKLVENINEISSNKLSVVVYNFVDMLSHSRTEMKMIRELADDESAYRSLTLSWFEHSPLIELLKGLAEKGVTVVLTTDHGTIRVNNPIKVVGDKNTTTNLRYKQGRNLNYNPKEVFEITNPADARLPKTNISSVYIFATGDDFFAYPNNYNHYVKYYKNTFQHGGISLEEMLIPVAVLKGKM